MPKAEYHIVIVGSGNMAHAMGRLLSAKHRIVQVVSRNEQTGKSLAKKLKAPFSSNIKDVYRQADFYLLCVPDDQVGRVSKQLKQIKGVLVHHSGAMPLDVLQSAQKAVLYPFVSVNPQTVLNKKKHGPLLQYQSCFHRVHAAIAAAGTALPGQAHR